ncbi:cobyric acid synthase [Microbispora sp. RL4-1S]|uniref:Cobyric acid synthase n=1 Tax=Microbispora oryzae TaxID=2806554 RepID=A0A940WEJ4_9ACTN|nr:cobyric acid synthase [Microbispora oryzae]MBP2704011.1 cobyric acid synthase [Microbispora oryzae]
MSGALLVAGTTSDAGKSVLTAGLCRWLARRGVRVAPFKAQNMALNSMVTADGGEIGRAQAMQAAAARVEPEAAMNPVLLKPSGERHSHVVVLGRAHADVDAMSYRDHKMRLLDVAVDALADLRRRFDVVICEGAGSPAEVNLRDRDIANMGLARAAGLPVLVVGDIDRGGVLAHFAGTLAVLDPADQRHLAGFVVNKFRGDPALLQPGLDWLRAATGRPCLGVLPWRSGLWLDVEDSLDLDSRPGLFTPPVGPDVLNVALVRLPRMSNVTDADALAAEPGVAVRLVTSAAEAEEADLVVVPGTRATVSDLNWMRERGIDAALRRRAAAGRPVVGVCGGLQMLGAVIDDEVESRAGRIEGLGLLPVRTEFGPEKVLALPSGRWRGHEVTGYQIHHGRVRVEGGEPFLDGCRVGQVYGTTWHGLFDGDGFRRAFLAEVAAAAGRDWRPGTGTFAERREARLDALGDLVEEHLDTDAVWRLIEGGVPAGLPPVAMTLGAPGAGTPGGSVEGG